MNQKNTDKFECLDMDFKDQWSLETALKIVQHPTVDSKLWAEAVEWLLLYGPPEIRQVLLQASETATSTRFPELRPVSYTREGEPCYDVKTIAAALGIDEDEAKKIIAKKEALHKKKHFIDQETIKLQ